MLKFAYWGDTRDNIYRVIRVSSLLIAGIISVVGGVIMLQFYGVLFTDFAEAREAISQGLLEYNAYLSLINEMRSWLLAYDVSAGIALLAIPLYWFYLTKRTNGYLTLKRFPNPKPFHYQIYVIPIRFAIICLLTRAAVGVIYMVMLICSASCKELTIVLLQNIWRVIL